MERRAKIIATIGPASQDKDILEDLIQAGVNIVRLNFSHGSHKEHASIIKQVRKIGKRLEKPIGIMQDLQGPKIRIGELKNDRIHLKPGQLVILTTKPNGEKIPVDFPDLPKVVKKDSRILLDDGNLELIVSRIQGSNIEAIVELGGDLFSNKGINLPGTHIDLPILTKKDEGDLLFGLEQDVDAVAISFVQTAEDVIRVKNFISKKAPNQIDTPVIAKMERPEALDNLDEIIDVADGVMVARGDLGVEMAPEVVPIAQKRIIEAANRGGKIVITATQMLESMIHYPRPTRAEATDVANAIFDGTDAVMLSGETAVGKYPIKAVEMMDAIIHESEKNLKAWGHWRGTPHETIGDDATSITMAGRELAHDLNVSAIVVFTQTGRTARLMSKALPRVPIIGFTPEEGTYRRMSFYWGVFPRLIPFANSIEEMLSDVDQAMIESTPLKPGQQVVVITGFPVGARRLPNLALLYTVGQKQ